MVMAKRKICVVTGTRAEYGLLRWVIDGIAKSPVLELQLIATGMHLSPEFGLTVQEIEADGHRIDRKVEMLLSSDTPVGITKSIGLGMIGFADALADLQPDLLLVLADMTETENRIDTLGDILPDYDQRLSTLAVPVLLVLNKYDLSVTGTLPESNLEVLAISAKTGHGLPELRRLLKQRAGYRNANESRFSARRRHLTALEKALRYLQQGGGQLQQHRAGELLAEDLRAAQQALEEITGAFSAEDLLGKIFSSFCIGK